MQSFLAWIYIFFSFSIILCTYFCRHSICGFFKTYLCIWKKVRVSFSHSFMSDSFRLPGLWPVRLLYGWDFPGKNTGVGSHFLLQGSSRPRDQTCISCNGRWTLHHWAPWEAQKHTSAQFSSVAQSFPTLWDPMDCSTPGLPVHHQLWEFTQTHVHRVCDAIQLSLPLSSPSPPALNLSQHQGLFQWVSSSHPVPHQSFQWIFRTDFL